MGIECITADAHELPCTEQAATHTGQHASQAAHSRNAEVVGKGLCRVLAPHVLCPDSVRGEGLEEVATVPSEVASPIAIQRHLHHRVLCTEEWASGAHNRGLEATGSTEYDNN